jgi:protein O-GlcNAc transferase
MTETTVRESLNSAAQCFNNNDLEGADFQLRRIMQGDPKNADALHMLALVRFRQGKVGESIKLIEDALKSRPDDLEFLTNLGNLTKSAGDRKAARAWYERAIAIDSNCLAPCYNLALLSAEEGDLDAAIDLFKRALKIDAELAELHFNLSLILKAKGDKQAAIESCKNALRLRPDFLEGHICLGNLYFEEEKPLDALAAFRAADKIKPDTAIVLNGIGVCQTSLGDYNAAKESLQKATALAPSLPDVHNNVGIVFSLLGDYSSAITNLNHALKLNPNYPEAWRNCGNVFSEQRRYGNAIEFYKKALALQPDFYPAQLEMSIALREHGDSQAAKESFARAQALNPLALAPLCGSIGAGLPNFYWDDSEIAACRTQYDDQLTVLENKLTSTEFDHIDLTEAEDALILLQPYYLSYQGGNNCKLYERYGKLLQKTLAARYPDWSKAKTKRHLKPGEKIRLGIASGNFSNHADWRMITSGLVDRIDRERFELFGYSTGGIVDTITEKAKAKIDHYYRGLSFIRLCQQIEQDQLDILLFPELGMDPISLKLGCLRLAPVQCCAWGRTETSGLTTIDYYISPGAMEPDDAQDHYVERLVKLPEFGSYYEPQNLPDASGSVDSLGLRKDAIKFLCVQSLFKYLPKYDFVFTEIVKSVPNAQFIFVARPDGLGEKLLQRLKRSFEKEGLDADRHFVMLPYLSHPNFLELCRTSDIFLDTIGFTGCVTVLDALEHSLPVVTLCSEYMRGRQSTAMLNILELPELIAQDANDYVQKVVKLANDAEYRQAIRERIANNKQRLYRNESVIKALEDNFQSWVSQ